MTPRRTAVAVLAVSVLAAGTTGCQDDAARTDGPLRAGGDPGELCLPRKSPGQEVTYGLDTVANPGAEPARVERVWLDNAHGIELLDAYLVPIVHQTLVGNWSQWPPPHEHRPATAWGAPLTISGTELAPGGPARNLVLHLRVTDDTATARFDAVHVGYTVAGTDYEAVTSTAVLVQDTCS